jgi:ATP-dependent RNA helicase DeaD
VNSDSGHDADPETPETDTAAAADAPAAHPAAPADNDAAADAAPVDADTDDPADTVEADGFAALGLDPRILRTIAALGYEEPTPVQAAAIPPLLAGRDLLAEAPTGTGKTAAFALPILQALAISMDKAREAGSDVGNRGMPRDGRGSRPTALVLTPTRELAMQVAEAIHKYGREIGCRVVPVYGGQPITAQLARLSRGVDVVVATPGRAVDHIDRGTLRFDEVQTVVLDEADEMLDMGFADDLDKILSALPTTRRTALFSATIAGPIARLAERHLQNPVRVRVRAEREVAGEQARVRHMAYIVRRMDKLAALGRILDLEDGAATLVFARTRGEVDDLAEALSARGRDAAALHGGLAQEQRDRIMGRFRDGSLDVLVATDVAARGLDIDHVSHVVNYDVPSSPEVYVHRTGRTGRAGREGTAITLVEPRESRLMREIERVIGRPMEIAGLPTVADLRAKRMELLVSSLRAALTAGASGANDRYKAVVEPLAEEFGLLEIALAAVAQADAEARGAEDTAELAPAFLPGSAPMRGPGPGFGPGARPGPVRRPFGRMEHVPPHAQMRPQQQWQGGPQQGGQQWQGQPGQVGQPWQPQQGGPQQQWEQRPPFQGSGPVRPRETGAPLPPSGDEGYQQQRPMGPRPAAPHTMGPRAVTGPRRGFRTSEWHDAEGRPVMRAPASGSGGPGGATRLFVGLGRAGGMRPADLVGAITHEAGLSGRDVGAIQIADGFSLVDVPEAAADRVISALRAATIRGRQVMVRRERY